MLVKFLNSSGIEPSILLTESPRKVRDDILPRVSGRVPVRLLSNKLNFCKNIRSPILLGRVPSRPLLVRLISVTTPEKDLQVTPSQLEVAPLQISVVGDPLEHCQPVKPFEDVPRALTKSHIT